MDYFEDTWVGRLHRSGQRRQLMFQILWWNVYNSTMAQQAKTDNACQATLGSSHPNLYQILEILKKNKAIKNLQ